MDKHKEDKVPLHDDSNKGPERPPADKGARGEIDVLAATHFTEMMTPQEHAEAAGTPKKEESAEKRPDEEAAPAARADSEDTAQDIPCDAPARPPEGEVTMAMTAEELAEAGKQTKDDAAAKPTGTP